MSVRFGINRGELKGFGEGCHGLNSAKQIAGNLGVFLNSQMKSARGLAHSKTLRDELRVGFRASVLECGGPPPLFRGHSSYPWAFAGHAMMKSAVPMTEQAMMQRKPASQPNLSTSAPRPTPESVVLA